MHGKSQGKIGQHHRQDRVVQKKVGIVGRKVPVVCV
jgi:hypothetical protein